MRHPGELQTRIYRVLLGSDIPLNTATIVSAAKRPRQNEEGERIQTIRILKNLVENNHAIRDDRGHANVVYYLTDQGKIYVQQRITMFSLSQPKVYPFCSEFSIPFGHASMALPIEMPKKDRKEFEENVKRILDLMPPQSYVILRKELASH